MELLLTKLVEFEAYKKVPDHGKAGVDVLHRIQSAEKNRTYSRQDSANARDHSYIRYCLVEGPFSHDQAGQEKPHCWNKYNIDAQQGRISYRRWITCSRNDACSLGVACDCGIDAAQRGQRRIGCPGDCQIQPDEQSFAGERQQHHVFVDSLQSLVERQENRHIEQVCKDHQSRGGPPIRCMFGEKDQRCLSAWRRKATCINDHHGESQEIPYSQNNPRETSHAIDPFPLRVNCELHFFVHFISPFLTMSTTYLA